MTLRQAGPILLLVSLLALAPAASAHAVLQSATPPPNGHADRGLSVVEYVFTEDLEREYTGADVFDGEGNSMAAGPVEFDPERANVLRLPVKPLPDGIYEATWKALSVDTHTTRGAFVFAVGNATLAPNQYLPIVESQDQDAVMRDGFARFAYYAGLFLALGMPLFALVVLREAPGAPLFRTAAAFGIVGALAAFVGLLFLGQRTDLGLGAAASAPGRSFVWRGILLAGAAIACAWAAAAPARWRALSIAAIGLALASLVATTLGSHAASARELRTLYVVADGVHLLMGAVWVGGVVAFLHLAWGQGADALARLILRFSPLAVASVVVVVATGTLAALSHMPCWPEDLGACVGSLRTERYVQLVAVKAALMLPLVVMGAYHRYRVAPRLSAAPASAGGFRRVAQAEAAVMALVLLAAGVLASTAPPASDVEQGAGTLPPYLELAQLTPGSHVILQVSPNPVKVGLQKIVVAVHPLGGPLENSTRVQIKVYEAEESEPELTIPLEKVTPNEWEKTDGFFTHDGPWKVTVLLQRPSEFTKLTFDVNVTR